MSFRKLRCRSKIQSWYEPGLSDAAVWVLDSVLRSYSRTWPCTACPEVESNLMPSGGWAKRQLSVCLNGKHPGLFIFFYSAKGLCKPMAMTPWSPGQRPGLTNCRTAWLGEKGDGEGAEAWGAELPSCQHLLNSPQPQPSLSTVSLTVTGSPEFKPFLIPSHPTTNRTELSRTSWGSKGLSSGNALLDPSGNRKLPLEWVPRYPKARTVSN